MGCEHFAHIHMEDDLTLVAVAVIAARHSADWRQLHRWEPQLQRASTIDLAPFHSLLLPLRSSAQRAVAAREAEALRTQNHRWPASDALSASAALGVAILRGSANNNEDRLATLLSIDAHRFSARLFTSELEPTAVAHLESVNEGRHSSMAHLNDANLAHRLSRYHIILDCSGHTRGNRLAVLARRPAAVATAVLGYPGSYGGHGLVDYLTVDRLVCAAAAPSTARCNCPRERLSILPTSYMVPPQSRGQLSLPPTQASGLRVRGQQSLPPGRSGRSGGAGGGGAGGSPATTARRPLLGSFTRTDRWHPSSFELWTAILRHTGPRTRLVLLAEDATVQRRISDELAAHGLQAHRALFGRYRSHKASHLARHAQLTLCVDSTPLYASHTTGADCLWAAVPLLTLPAEGWASRVGTSTLSAVSQPLTASTSAKALVDLAARLIAPPSSSSGPVRVLEKDADQARGLRRAIVLSMAAPPFSLGSLRALVRQ